MFNNDTTKFSEEIIFYLDLLSDFLEKNKLREIIKEFIEEKNTYNKDNTYGVLIFIENDNPKFLYNQNNSDELIQFFDSNFDSREKSESYFENGLFEVLSHIFEKSRSIERNFRIIVLTDTPSDRSEDYHNALYDLLIKAKSFHTSIDIIRVGSEKFYSDDVKLKIISSETHGGSFYCTNLVQFRDTMNSLIKNKQEFNVISKKETILEEDKLFFEKLAVDLISLDGDDEEICLLCNQEVCPICEAYMDEIHKCYNCGAKFHGCCIGEYALTNNIGFNHLLRCPQCETLLKLDEKFIDILNKEKQEELGLTSSEIPVIEEVSPLPDDGTSVFTEVKKTVKVGGYFGQKINVKASAPFTTMDFKPKSDIVQPQSQNIEIVSITRLRPPRKKLKICPMCGTSVRGGDRCSNCGSKV